METRRPNKSLRHGIRQDCIDYIRKNTIRNQENKRTVFREMHMRLAETGLLTMLISQLKPPPESDPFNPSGFVEGHNHWVVYTDSFDDTDSINTENREEHIEDIHIFHGLNPRHVFINDDNLDLYQHDSGRLVVLVLLMFHEEYHPFAQEDFINQDPIAYYHSIYRHVFSKKPRELAYQR